MVPSANRNETIVTNGMSHFARDGKNANSALVCSVSAEDFGGDPFEAMRFQEKIERTAFVLGKSKAPAQSVGAFIRGGVSDFTKVEPTYAGGVSEANLSELFPDEVVSVLKKGILQFDRKISGFADPKAILTGPETRTSSPIRIVRNPDSYEAAGVSGLYPCAEGAGYAGGIMSAAVDGIRTALAIIERVNG